MRVTGVGGSTPSLWRRRWYAVPGRQHRLECPVISVGNLSFGGRGKTPTVAFLARILVEAGERPAILTRGYGRTRNEDGVVVVSDAVHLLADLDRSGDEPLMLAKAVPGAAVLVCDQRALAGALAERALQATVHLLDDGFQHLQLARDLDLVIITAGDLDDRPLPFGRLREPVTALAYAHAIIADGGAAGLSAPAKSLQTRDSQATFSLRRSLGAPVLLEPDQSWPEGRGPIVAVAGIAEPQRFFRALSQAGWTVVETLGFPDHHRYSSNDLARIASVAAHARAPVLTTSKDATRLLAMRPLPVPMAFAPLEVTIEPQAAFRDWLWARLREARA